MRPTRGILMVTIGCIYFSFNLICFYSIIHFKIINRTNFNSFYRKNMITGFLQ